MGESYCSSIFLGIFCWERKKKEKSVCLRQEKHENKGWFEVWDESLNTRRNEPNKMAEAIGGRQRIHKLAKLSVFFVVRRSSLHRYSEGGNNDKKKQNKR